MKKYPAHDNFQRSRPHRYMEKVLGEMGISFMSEQPFPPYTVDIYLPEWHLAIEIDGPFHSAAKDKLRDDYLEVTYGLRLMRKDIRWFSKTPKLRQEILKFIEDNEPTYWDRKQVCPTLP